MSIKLLSVKLQLGQLVCVGQQKLIVFVVKKDFFQVNSDDIGEKELQDNVKRYDFEMEKILPRFGPVDKFKKCLGQKDFWQFTKGEDEWIFTFKNQNQDRTFNTKGEEKEQTLDGITKQEFIIWLLKSKQFVPKSPEKKGKQLAKQSPKKKQQQSSTKKQQQQQQLQDIDIAKNPYIKLDKPRKEAYSFNGQKITKDTDTQICLVGKDTIKYAQSYKIKITKLSKQFRNPTIWIGFAKSTLGGEFNIQKCQREDVIAMSDKCKIFKFQKYFYRYQQDEKSEEEFKYFEKEFQVGDVITVEANRNTGIVSWKDPQGLEFGSYLCEEIKKDDFDWAPYIEIWKAGDQIQWVNILH